MARKSKHRRLLAKQGAQAVELKQLRSVEHGKEMAVLQQGSPLNSSGRKFERMTTAAQHVRPSRELSWETSGKIGRIVKGQLKPKLGRKTWQAT